MLVEVRAQCAGWFHVHSVIEVPANVSLMYAWTKYWKYSVVVHVLKKQCKGVMSNFEKSEYSATLKVLIALTIY